MSSDSENDSRSTSPASLAPRMLAAPNGPEDPEMNLVSQLQTQIRAWDDQKASSGFDPTAILTEMCVIFEKVSVSGFPVFS